MLEEESRLLGLGYFRSRILTAPKGTSVVQELLVRVSQLALESGCRITIYRDVQLRDEGRSFLLCDEGCTTFLDGRLLGLPVYQVSFVLKDGMRGSRILDGFQMVPTRIYGCLGVHP